MKDSLKTCIIFGASVLLWMCFRRSDIKVINNQTSQNNDENRIPSIVHFIVGLIDEKNATQLFPLAAPFAFINYLTFLAARRHLRPKKFFVHYYEEPKTFWWNLTKHDVEINITLVKVRLVDNIFGNPVYHHSHRSDILRLEILLEYGGIYLDTDVLPFRSFDSLLNLSDVVLGRESLGTNEIGSAVILSKKNATFLKRIYDAYQSYDYTCWVCHATILPGKLALIYSREVILLPPNAFFLPGYQEEKTFFKSNDYNFTSNYASHLWNKVHNKRLRELSPGIILNGNFTLARMLREAIGKSTLFKLKKFIY